MRNFLLLAGFATLSASGLGAQANACPIGGRPTDAMGSTQNALHDACTQAVDVFQFVAPQLGLALVGGNATLGQGGTLGGLGHFTIGVRANAFYGDLPEIDKFPEPRTDQAQPALVLPSKDQAAGLPVVDAAFGLFKGFPVGVTNVGGIDLLVNGAYVPTVGNEGDDIRVEPESNFRFGFGARVGILQESLVVPGLSATYIRRDLPTTSVSGTSPTIDVSIDKTKVETSAWRIVASKNFIVFGLALGYGQDTYDQSTSISGRVKNIATPFGSVTSPFGPIAFAQKVTRNNMFADASINMAVVKIVGEVGQVSGGTFTAPLNTFSSGRQDESRMYASVGLRFGW